MVIVVILTLLLHKGVRLIPAVVIAVVMSVGIEQFFGELLDVPLPWGILENYSSVLSWK
jgi:putative tricarboxylic transport membrane protein